MQLSILRFGFSKNSNLCTNVVITSVLMLYVERILKKIDIVFLSRNLDQHKHPMCS